MAGHTVAHAGGAVLRPGFPSSAIYKWTGLFAAQVSCVQRSSQGCSIKDHCSLRGAVLATCWILGLRDLVPTYSEVYNPTHSPPQLAVNWLFQL